VVEAVDALGRGQLLERLRIRVDEAQRALVAALEFLEQIVGFLVQPPGIDAEHVDLGDVGPDDVGEHHRLGAEAVRVDHPAVLACGREELLAHARRLPLEIEIQ
jgi:hypothetical protein